MIEGKLLPSAEEIKKKGRGVIYPRIHTINGTIGEEKFTLGFGLAGDVFITYLNRTVRFRAEDMVKEAVAKINEAETKRSKEENAT